MPYKDPAEQQAAVKRWRIENTELVRAYRRRYYRKNRRKIAARRLRASAKAKGKPISEEEALKKFDSREAARRFGALVAYELADGPRPPWRPGRPREYPGGPVERHRWAQRKYRKPRADPSTEGEG
jgi:hypothetical protein